MRQGRCTLWNFCGRKVWWVATACGLSPPPRCCFLQKPHAASGADPSGSAPLDDLAAEAKKATDFGAYRLEIVRVATDGAGRAVNSAGRRNSDRFSRLTA